MSQNQQRVAKLLGEAVDQCLREGNQVELDGLGIFAPSEGQARFTPDLSPRVFIAYAVEDLVLASRLYDDLAEMGFRPWMDRKKLLPGQNWSRAIDRAVETSDFFIACFSQVSTFKRGQFPYELRLALRCSEKMPLDDLFLVPIRFEPCSMPRRIHTQLQYVDLFPDWALGVSQLVRSIQEEWNARRSRKTSL